MAVFVLLRELRPPNLLHRLVSCAFFAHSSSLLFGELLPEGVSKMFDMEHLKVFSQSLYYSLQYDELWPEDVFLELAPCVYVGSRCDRLLRFGHGLWYVSDVFQCVRVSAASIRIEPAVSLSKYGVLVPITGKLILQAFEVS